MKIIDNNNYDSAWLERWLLNPYVVGLVYSLLLTFVFYVFLTEPFVRFARVVDIVFKILIVFLFISVVSYFIDRKRIRAMTVENKVGKKHIIWMRDRRILLLSAAILLFVIGLLFFFNRDNQLSYCITWLELIWILLYMAESMCSRMYVIKDV